MIHRSPVVYLPTRHIVLFVGGVALTAALASPLYAAGLAAAPLIGAEAGTLVIGGGGDLPAAVLDRFFELAGGKKARIVVIPTANKKADTPLLLKSFTWWKERGAASVVVLHTRDPRRADDLEFVKPLKEATAVWFAGGDQNALMAPYRGTAVEIQLHKLLARGGVVGGTSAGAAVMSAVMITGGNPAARVASGFGFAQGVVIDQHFRNRKRLDRLLAVLKQSPRHLGLGIDEGTAIIVSGGTVTVIGRDHVSLCLLPLRGQPPAVRLLQSGDRVDLAALVRPETPAKSPSSPALLQDGPAQPVAKDPTNPR